MKRLICIGGGEIRTRETILIDDYIAGETKKLAGNTRACGLFIPTASHDCMPYYNSFHKIYTGIFDIKTDVALTTRQNVDSEKMRKKFACANFIYVGGGDLSKVKSKKKKGAIVFPDKKYGSPQTR